MRLVLSDIRHRRAGAAELVLSSLALAAGESALLLGPSGSGKSTLIAIAAGLLRPQQGRVVIDGIALSDLPTAAVDRLRGRRVGLVFQQLHLVPSLTVADQLRLARRFAGLPRDDAAIAAVLDRLGLHDKARVRPAQLSGGEAQRVAIARAIVNEPAVLLADEPTASLDDANAAAVLDLLEAAAARSGAALLIATHDARATARIVRQHRLPSPASTGTVVR